jgi:hypothetical protein
MADLLSGVVAEDMRKRYGGLFNVVHIPLTVGVTPVRVLPPNVERAFVLFTAPLAEVFFLMPGAQLAANTGIVLTGPDYIKFSIVRDFILPTLEWWAVCSGAGGTLELIEITRTAKL